MTGRPVSARAVRVRALAALLAAGLALAAGPAGAQGTCNVNFRASCNVGASATAAMNLTIPAVVRLSAPAATLALPAATATEFTAGFGTALSVPLTLRANTTWSVTLRATAATWTGTGPLARTNKPAADLQWGLAAAGPFTDVTTGGTGISAGAATAGQTIPLHLRVRYAWTLDRPGSYSLPLQLTITAP